MKILIGNYPVISPLRLGIQIFDVGARMVKILKDFDHLGLLITNKSSHATSLCLFTFKNGINQFYYYKEKSIFLKKSHIILLI